MGVDIGGTTTKIGLVTDSGTVVGQCTHPVPFESGRDASLQALFSAIESCVSESGLSVNDCHGIGVAAPGTLDLPAGVILHPFNVPDWKDLPLRDLVSNQFGLPTVLQNDANAAAFGEYWLGAASDAESLMFWTLGTGVGGGIILNGEILSGAHSHAGECGHMILQMEGGPRCRVWNPRSTGTVCRSQSTRSARGTCLGRWRPVFIEIRPRRATADGHCHFRCGPGRR